MCCVALPCHLFDLAYFFLPAFSSLIKTCIYAHTFMYLLMRDAEGRKKEASKVKQTNKAKQHSTPKAVTLPKKKMSCQYIHVYIHCTSLLGGAFCIAHCVCMSWAAVCSTACWTDHNTPQCPGTTAHHTHPHCECVSVYV